MTSLPSPPQMRSEPEPPVIVSSPASPKILVGSVTLGSMVMTSLPRATWTAMLVADAGMAVAVDPPITILSLPAVP
jgi:hypothetical protein